jgi:hypothetical protein
MRAIQLVSVRVHIAGDVMSETKIAVLPIQKQASRIFRVQRNMQQIAGFHTAT